MKRLSILVVDDEAIVRDNLTDFLSDYPYNILTADRPSAAFAVLAREPVDIILLDINLPEMTGLEALKIIRDTYPRVEVIMITAQNDSSMIIQALRLGAFDYFQKPFTGASIQKSIERTRNYLEISLQMKAAEYSHALLPLEVRENIGDIVGKSPAICADIDLAMRAAESPDASVFITGESGSGKELMARLVHYAGARKNAVFYPVNCSAIPDTLIESEFFGHTKGAFTNAIEDKQGCFETAHGGTIFLDEIADMSMEAQAKMLRVLEERKFRRLGSPRDISVDIRVISATNKDVKALIENGRLRADLYYRLNTIEITVPPLRSRTEDIPALVMQYVSHFGRRTNKTVTASPAFINALLRYPFPGNVRELKNIIERAVILCNGCELLPEHLPFNGAPASSAPSAAPVEIFDLDAVERNTVAAALKKTCGHKSNTAALLGISRPALDRKIEKYHLE